MQRAIDTWALVSRGSFGLQADSLPWVVLFDARCTWHLAPRHAVGDGAREATAEAGLRFGGASVAVQSLAHHDSVRLPSGRVLSPGPTAFASLYRGDSASFVVMALPHLWGRGARATADPGLDEFFLGVLAHEMAHTAQLAAISRRVRTLGRRWTLPRNLNDDIVQQQFDSVPGFRQSIEQERDLLFEAATAPDDASRRRLARRALTLAEARRGRHFIGENAVYAELEDLFLLMEGVGSWAAYRVALAHAPPGSTWEAVIGTLRPGRYWSQEMGLAVFLVLDTLLPEWRSRVFALEPPSVFELLHEAVQSR